MTETTEPRAWVGCLACYNAGRLVGEWFEGTEIPTDHAEWLAASPDACSIVGHEELWIFDHEGYGPTLKGECSPAEAQSIAETLADVEDEFAFFAYLSVLGTGPDTLANIGDTAMPAETAMPPTDAESIQRARLTLERPGATDAECRAARATLRTAALLAELASAQTR